MEQWFRRAIGNSHVGSLIGVLPIIATWELWNWRCDAKMEGQFVSIKGAWQVIKFWMGYVALKLIEAKKLSSVDEIILKGINIQVRFPKILNVRLVRWCKPQSSWYKLNVDGCCIGNLGRISAGGILRNNNGELCKAFCRSLGHDTNNSAKIQALLQGLLMCQRLGMSWLEIELDSRLVVDWVIQARCGVWYLKDFWEEIMQILDQMNYSICQIYREANIVADFFAKKGVDGVS